MNSNENFNAHGPWPHRCEASDGAVPFVCSIVILKSYEGAVNPHSLFDWTVSHNWPNFQSDSSPFFENGEFRFGLRKSPPRSVAPSSRSMNPHWLLIYPSSRQKVCLRADRLLRSFQRIASCRKRSRRLRSRFADRHSHATLRRLCRLGLPAGGARLRDAGHRAGQRIPAAFTHGNIHTGVVQQPG
jgi:hypothetical protein